MPGWLTTSISCSRMYGIPAFHIGTLKRYASAAANRSKASLAARHAVALAEARSKDRAATAAWGSLLRVHASLVPQLDSELQRSHRLALAWYDVLLELRYAPDKRLRMTELGDRVTLIRTRVSRLVDEMFAAGLVRRESNPDDRRSAYAALTTQGRTVFDEAAPTYLGGIRQLFADALSTAELTTVGNALEKVLQHEAGRNPA